jgi:hypothetical protein
MFDPGFEIRDAGWEKTGSGMRDGKKLDPDAGWKIWIRDAGQTSRIRNNE